MAAVFTIGVTNMKQTFRLLRLASGLLAVVLFSGCALTKSYIPLAYTAQTGVSKVAGADNVAVNVTISDQRADKSSVGAKKNGYGMEMAPIIATNDVATLLKSAIETELASRGFNPGASKTVSVTAEINTFWNDFKNGFWSGDAVAQVILNITVKNEARTIVYAKLVSGQGINPSIQLASGENAKVALEAALKDALDKLFGDYAFIDALVKSKQP